jgi:hypothetical protein
MNEPSPNNFPHWMLEQPWDTLISYITDARDAAVQIKLTTHFLLSDPAVAQMRVKSPVLDRPQRVEDLTAQINEQANLLLQTLESLEQFRAAVKQQSEMRERAD